MTSVVRSGGASAASHPFSDIPAEALCRQKRPFIKPLTAPIFLTNGGTPSGTPGTPAKWQGVPA